LVRMIITVKGMCVFLLVMAYFLFCSSTVGLADTLKSTNFQFEETALGGSGLIGSQSANFQATSSTGILGLDISASTNLQVEAGNLTTNDPALSFAVNNGNISFGSFSAGAASTATTTFQVINYTSYGYVVQIIGTAPTNGAHTIAPMASTAPSQAGTDQFGINLVANTSPVSLGANPDHGQFGFGSATTNYGTSNNYRFVSGETIASSPKSSGQTIYTISYIVNVNNLTPGGNYNANQTLICTGTY
jgi:hypothetical protein